MSLISSDVCVFAGGGGNEWKLADQAAEVAKKAAGMSFPGMVITGAERGRTVS